MFVWLPGKVSSVITENSSSETISVNSTMASEINEILRPIAWIAGIWESKNGAGNYPTISDFSYNDIIEFRLCGKQPLFAYTGSSSHPERGNPMHLESGFLRAHPASSSVSFMVAHNFGNKLRLMFTKDTTFQS